MTTEYFTQHVCPKTVEGKLQKMLKGGDVSTATKLS
jgi:hypothetical protein